MCTRVDGSTKTIVQRGYKKKKMEFVEQKYKNRGEKREERARPRVRWFVVGV